MALDNADRSRVDGLKICRQLEILHNNDDGKERGSLLWLLDHTRTPFGSRLLRSWVAHPLRDAARIAERLDAVEELVDAAGMPWPPTGVCWNGLLAHATTALEDAEICCQPLHMMPSA